MATKKTASKKEEPTKLSPFTALGDQLILQEENPGDKQTAGGIVIPATVYQDFLIGIVVAVGPGPRRLNAGEMTCKRGDRVMTRRIGMPFEYDGIKYYLIPEGDAVCILH